MEIAALILYGLCTAVGLLAAGIRPKHPYEALWVAGIAVSFLVFGLCASIHAKWSAGGQQAALAEDQRPWVSVVSPRVTSVMENKGIALDLPIRNTGGTPAVEVRAKVSAYFCGPEVEFDDVVAALDWEDQPSHQPLIIGPGRTTILQILCKHEIKKEFVEQIERGEIVMRLFCRLECRDIHGRPLRSWCCLTYDHENGGLSQDHRYWGME